jgi:hypothetical protein
MIKQRTAPANKTRRKTPSGVLQRGGNMTRRYREEIKKQKAKNHATRSDFTLDSSAIESQRLQHDVVIVARI